MMVWDTSVLIAGERKDQEVDKKLNLLHTRYSGAVAIAAPTYSEFLYGFLIKKPLREAEVRDYLDDFLLLHTTRSSCRRMAELKCVMQKKGKMGTDMDIMIASLVMEHGGVLITRDKQFREIDGLRVEVV